MKITKPYYRIYRPGVFAEYCTDSRNANNYAMLCRVYKVFENDLKNMFEYIEPCDDNLNTYSHRTYELFLRAATEFETNAKQILSANGYIVNDRTLNISDYYKINRATKLSEYELYLEFWRPNKKIIIPFGDWNNQSSLGWYQDYNSVKHDRQVNFSKASFLNTINAIAAVLVILYSQFDFNTQIVYTPNAQINVFDDGSVIPFGESMFGIKKPTSWTDDEKYNFNWNLLKNDQNPFQKYRF